jgi:hypothetical protein
MSENPLLNPSDASPKNPGTRLNPVLVKALASLEVQLDQELARYRRTRIGSRVPNPPRIVSSITAQSLGINLFTPTENPNPPSPTTQITTHKQLQEIISEKTTTERSPLGQIPSPHPQSAVTAKTPTPSPSNSSSIVPTTAKSNPTTNVPGVTNNSSVTDDYLESSEALLRSLTEEQEQKTTEEKSKSTSDGLLSPLGIGSMLLLLLASLTLGYVLFNPKSLPKFSFNGLFQRQSPKITGTTEVGEQNTPSQPETPTSPIPKYPNLAQEEFPEVNNPNDIVGLTPKAQATPSQPPIPVIAPPTPKTSPVAVTPTQAIAIPTPTTTPTPKITPTPEVSPQATQIPLTNIKPSSDGFYHVVTDNQGDNAFTKAKGIVGDAYLSDDKKMIYLGAVKSKTQVEQLLKQLKTQGINARVKQP